MSLSRRFGQPSRGASWIALCAAIPTASNRLGGLLPVPVRRGGAGFACPAHAGPVPLAKVWRTGAGTPGRTSRRGCRRAVAEHRFGPGIVRHHRDGERRGWIREHQMELREGIPLSTPAPVRSPARPASVAVDANGTIGGGGLGREVTGGQHRRKAQVEGTVWMGAYANAFGPLKPEATYVDHGHERAAVRHRGGHTQPCRRGKGDESGTPLNLPARPSRGGATWARSRSWPSTSTPMSSIFGDRVGRPPTPGR